MDPVRASLLAVLFLGCSGTPPQVQPDQVLPPGSVQDAPAQASAAPVSAAWSALAQEGIAAGEYAPQVDGDGFRATNRAQDLHAAFGPHGLNVSGRSGTGEVGLSLRGWGREDAMMAADAASPEEGPCLSGGAVDALGDCLHRIDYARPGLTEWWENRSEGLEQGFTVTAPPDGDGALVFELALTGAIADVDGDEALLVRESGDPMRFGGLAAWDATGRSLPAWMEETDGGLRILVDDSGAIGAVTVDPLLTTASWTAESDNAYSAFGRVVASAGDVNGDGFGDVAIGAPYYIDGISNGGRVYVYLGSASGLATTAAWTALPNQVSAAFGYSVASAGDVNGDGYGDLVVGAYAYDGAQYDCGSAYVYLGSAAGLGASAAWTAESDQAYAWFGTSVASAGDVNADGYGDVVVGANYYDNGESDEGRTYVYLGSASGLAATAAWTAEANQADAQFGYAVGSAGDVNGDGYSDVIVGANSYDNGETNEGRVYVYLGSAAGLTTTPWTAESNQYYAWYGYSVASAGDVNGDGYGDVLVGAYGWDNTAADAGKAFLYLGSATGLAATAAWTGESDQTYAWYGTSVSSAGDVNGDGYSDVVVGANYYDNGQTNEGRVYMYLGSSSGLATTAAWTAESDQDSANYGYWVASGGDVNGDGYGDVLVGAQAWDNGQTDAGRAYVYMGAASGLATSAGWTGESNLAGAGFGTAVGAAGDVNGDGYGDVIVGAKWYANGETYEGRAFLYLGSGTGLATTAAWTAESNQASACFGTSVASAGDVNGDGYADVMVGAPYYDNGSTDEGRAYVYLGSASGLASTAAWTSEADVAGAFHGFSVSSAGDVNGDGYGDVIVGARSYANGQSNEGRATVYLGSSSGLSTSAGWTVESNQTNVFFGQSVAGAGDVNGDGYSDVAVSAYGYSNGEADEGRVFVYRGSVSGLATTAAWTAESNQAYAEFGNVVASAGDVNGDGYGDLFVGSSNYANGESFEGRSYVYLGSYTGLAATAAWTAEVNQAMARFGSAGGTAGDVNGDGYGDVVVGAIGYANGEAGEGRAYVYLGSTAGLATSAAWTVESNQASAQLGLAAGSAGDVNGDGYGDLVVGAPAFDNGQTDEGRATLYMGNGADGTGLGVARAAQARSPGQTVPISPGLTANAPSGFDVAMLKARGPWGRAKVKLQVEVKMQGTAFSGTGLTTSSAFTNTGLTGASIQQSVLSMVTQTGYHWRARVLASPAEGRAQGWGPWMYGGLSGGAGLAHVFTLGATYYADADGDGYGNPAVSMVLRNSRSGYVSNATDCNDSYSTIHPGASESCNGIDDNCDGITDPSSSVGAATWHVDSDHDGYGASDAGQLACTAPANFVFYGTDCNDTSAAVHPGATETCNGIDDDCNGVTDPSTSVGAPTWHADADNDTYGATGAGTPACSAPANYVSDATDCNDAAASAHPGGTETCDGLDNNCDGLTDPSSSVGAPTWYADVDHDAYGASGTSTVACTAPANYVASNTDCNDASAAVHPGATETCNGIDDNCDGATDPSISVGAALWHADADHDGYGATGTGTAACTAPAGSLADATDCNDAAATVHPGATDICNGVDDDCDGGLDRETASLALVSDATWHVALTEAALDAGTWESARSPAAAAFVYSSASIGRSFSAWQHTSTVTMWAPADMWGGSGVQTAAWFEKSFTIPTGAVITSAMVTTVADDDHLVYVNGVLAASDTSYSAGPVVDTDIAAFLVGGANTIRIYGRDNQSGGGGWLVVDGTIVYSATTSAAPEWHADADADGYGDPLTSVQTCTAPAGYVADASDCDDADDIVNPGATESCDGFDNDCDGVVDPTTSADAYTWYTDADDDGFGDPALDVVSCTPPAYTSLNDGDCDDTTAAVSPDGTESCNGVDDDCNGQTDEPGATGETTWYADADADTYGNAASHVLTCNVPGGYVSGSTDCDDAVAVVNPGATESCNHRDDDCDGATDESGSTGETTFFVDADFDTYGDPARTVVTCWEGNGAAADDDDCDDTLASVNPAALEYCNETDDDCNGITDDPTAEDAVVYYRDVDGDGYGGKRRPVLTCEQPSGYSAYSTDCRDSDATAYPGAPEACDGVDDDCDAVVDDAGSTIQPAWYTDADSDGYGAGSPTYSCTRPAHLDDDALDCDDAVYAVHPGVTEVCDSLDNNCDGMTDPSTSIGAATWHPDADADGYGATGGATTACTAPSGYLANATDCNDAAAAVHPGAFEVCNSVDDNCDGLTDPSTSVGASTWHADADGDGYGSSAAGTAACTAPAGYLADATDCNDAINAVHPGATETCNSIDDNCDGVTDPSTSVGASTWHADADHDGYGAIGAGTLACTAPIGSLADASDCNDGASGVHPGATETCNSIDDNCDGTTDPPASAGAPTWYVDADGDGYGTLAGALSSCTAIAGRVSNSSDCDDLVNTTYPAAPERCDGERNDCTISAWTSANENGQVWFETDAGVWASYTSTFAAGVSGTPAVLTLPVGGTMWVCDGTYYVRLTASAAGSTSVAGLYDAGILSAGGVGSVVTVSGASANLSLNGLTLQNGVGSGAPTRGGGLRVTAGTVTVSDCLIRNNTATQGAGLSVVGGTVTVTNSDIRSNVASTGGGWYQSGGTLTMNNTVVELNTATDGGGGYYATGPFTSTGLSLLDNAATATGGGLRANNAMTLTSASIVGNDAVSGAGVYYGGVGGTLALSSTLVDQNAATGYGGGVYQAGGTLTCTGSTAGTYGFTANTAVTGGGGVYLPLTTSVFTTTLCDFGATVATSNSPNDVLYGATAYNKNNDVTMSCRTGTCR